MKNHIITLAFYLFAATQSIAAQDTLWVHYDDRFLANGYIPLENVDSIEIQNSIFKLYDATINTGYKNGAFLKFLQDFFAEIRNLQIISRTWIKSSYWTSAPR